MSEVFSHGASEYALTSPDSHRAVRGLADDMLDRGLEPDDLMQMGQDPGRDMHERIATKLALSKQAITGVELPSVVRVTYGLFRERRRMLPAGPDNPHGEDALHTKLDQMDWLFGGTEVNWGLIAVDDGCPDDSGSLAQQRAQAHEHGGRVQVHYLEDHINDRPSLRGLDGDVNNSRKGGSILLGAELAFEQGAPFVMYTDSDTSVDLGQLGLLVGPYARDDEKVVIGNRKLPNQSILKKDGLRNGAFIPALRHMQWVVGEELFGEIKDAQAAFKLFDADVVRHVAERPTVYDFSFDIDWLYAAIQQGYNIHSVGFAFVDSAVESTTSNTPKQSTGVWNGLLHGTVKIARARGAHHDEAMAAVIEECVTPESLLAVRDSLPPELVGVAESDLGSVDVMNADQARAWLKPAA